MYICHFQYLALSLATDIFKGICCLGRRGIKILSLLPISVMTVSFMTFGPWCVICDRVPLRNLGISRLRISSTGTRIQSRLVGRCPDNSKMLKSSTVYDVPC
ncbi:hypothetical protein AVEN_123135-1 [Araneus ventricosus]|uniref:Uncharacterized protein n=1 Tax=Araneus ventricosus TaxID=182803 RepID=A0A4Y2GRQ2_ARAVE|nr:hypothetical protein AVEN_123135-1 [Araneus ventricosus]